MYLPFKTLKRNYIDNKKSSLPVLIVSKLYSFFKNIKEEDLYSFIKNIKEVDSLG
jgi:hypothetical protein